MSTFSKMRFFDEFQFKILLKGHTFPQFEAEAKGRTEEGVGESFPPDKIFQFELKKS